eukprot:12171630-Alexandrium_andersonii.AAC.1
MGVDEVRCIVAPLELPAADGDVPIGSDGVHGSLSARGSDIAGQSRAVVGRGVLELCAGLCCGGPGNVFMSSR